MCSIGLMCLPLPLAWVEMAVKAVDLLLSQSTFQKGIFNKGVSVMVL
jgi:hypothetical protein